MEERKEIKLSYLAEQLEGPYKGFGGPEDNPSYILCWEYEMTSNHYKFLKELGAKQMRKLKTSTLKYIFPSTIKLVNDLPKIEG